MCHFILDHNATLLVKCTTYLRTRDPLLCQGKRWTNPTFPPNIIYIDSERATGALQREEDAYHKALHLDALIHKQWKASREGKQRESDLEEELGLDLKTHRVPLSCYGGALRPHESLYVCPRAGSRWTDGVWATAEAHAGAQRDADTLDQRLEGIFRGIEIERGRRVRFCEEGSGKWKGKGKGLYEKMVRDEKRAVEKWRVGGRLWARVRRCLGCGDL